MYKRCKGDVQGDALEDMGDIQGDIQGDALGYGAFAFQAKWRLRRVAAPAQGFAPSHKGKNLDWA